MSRLMAAMLIGGARAAKLTGSTAVKQALVPTPACFLPPRQQPASWGRLCLQTAPRSSQVCTLLGPWQSRLTSAISSGMDADTHA